jgi:hypothetical protein
MPAISYKRKKAVTYQLIYNGFSFFKLVCSAQLKEFKTNT